MKEYDEMREAVVAEYGAPVSSALGEDRVLIALRTAALEKSDNVPQEGKLLRQGGVGRAYPNQNA